MLRLVAPTCALVLAAAGGVFFVLFSCGGYHWHEQLFWLVFTVAALGTIVAPPQALRAWSRRAGFVALAVITFVTQKESQ